MPLFSTVHIDYKIGFNTECYDSRLWTEDIFYSISLKQKEKSSKKHKSIIQQNLNDETFTQLFHLLLINNV